MRLGSQVAAALKQKTQLMDAVELTKLIQSVNFSSLMGIPEAELVSFGMKEGVVTKHKVTPYFCRRDSQGSHMSAGVVTALFDEISTMDVVLQDRTHRPGVSVTLHVDMFDTAVAPGTTLHLRSWAHKIGATLGFLAMRLEDHSGNLVATGSHVKFLPSPYGRAWDLCFHPLVYPILRTRLKSIVHPHVAKGEKVSIDHDHGSIYEHFPLHDLHLAPASPPPPAHHQQPHTTTTAAAATSDEEPPPSTSPLPATAATIATFKVQPRHCNGFFSLHGGALATITEDLALRDATHRLTSASPHSRTASAMPTQPDHPSMTSSHTRPSPSPSPTPSRLTTSPPPSSPPPSSPSRTPPPTGSSSSPPPLRTQSVSITYLAANPNGATVNLAAATPVDPRRGGPGGPMVSHVDVFGRGGKLTNQAVFVLREQPSTR